VIDMSALQTWFAVLIGWLDREERDALAFLIEENRILRASWVGGACASLLTTDDDWPCGRFGWGGGSCGRSPPS
jgi:hypothetical protein